MVGIANIVAVVFIAIVRIETNGCLMHVYMLVAPSIRDGLIFLEFSLCFCLFISMDYGYN